MFDLITFACGHDERLDLFISHHKNMIPGRIVTVYGGRHCLYKHDINSNGRYLGDGHLVPHIYKLTDEYTHVLYISHDALILENDLIQKSIKYMTENKIDILAPSLTKSEISPYTYGGAEVLTGIICLSLFTQKAFQHIGKNWMTGRPHVSEEVEFWETPHRAGFIVKQNPFIIPDIFTCRILDEKRREGGAIHPHKEWT